MPNVTVTNSTVVDICNFPSVYFGHRYTSRVANGVPVNTETGETLTHPEPSIGSLVPATVTPTEEGATVDNSDGLRNVLSITETNEGITVIENSGRHQVSAPVIATSQGATINSTFGGIASDQHVTTTATGATVTGRQCS